MRLINADALKADIKRRVAQYRHGDKPMPTIEDIINEQQVIEAEPIKHGRWVKNEDRSGWHCSCCGKDDLYAYPYTENNERELQDFYCPNCGAKMDGGEND